MFRVETHKGLYEPCTAGTIISVEERKKKHTFIQEYYARARYGLTKLKNMIQNYLQPTIGYMCQLNMHSKVVNVSRYPVKQNLNNVFSISF